MGFLRNVNELKIEVLKKCGELTDGTSPYDADAVTYLNELHQSVIAGGNIFGFDVAEPWIWAQSKRPVVLNLTPAVTGSATLTQSSRSGTFSSAPTISLAGRFFKVEGRSDYYKILAHTAASTAFTLDQPYLADSGTLNYRAIKLDYDAFDDTILIDSSNNKIDFKENSGTELTATITAGVYTPTTLCTEIKTQMEAAGAATYTITFDSLTRKFLISMDGTSLQLQFATGTNVLVSASEVLGFEMEDLTDDNEHRSTYALSAIVRVSKPMTMYREAPYYSNSAKDAGKIWMLDSNIFMREFPINRMSEVMPDKFCIIEQGVNGLWKLRFNGSVLEEDVRVELNVIPVTRKLVDSTNCYSRIPGIHSNFLIYGAAHFIALDKADNKAEVFGGLAKAQLQAMVNENRKGASLAGNQYGRLIPRQGQTRLWSWYK